MHKVDPELVEGKNEPLSSNWYTGKEKTVIIQKAKLSTEQQLYRYSHSESKPWF